MLGLFDTGRGEVVPVDPAVDGEVSLYVCGPTVYDDPHIGHGRFALVWDIIRRYLEWSGYRVRYVSNITDVDDKIIARALREGRTEVEVAREYTDVWFAAMDRLGVRRPDEVPQATGWMNKIIDVVQELVDNGSAYVIEGDGVYLDISAVPGYGLLARQDIDEMQAGARIAANTQKRHPADFAIWKMAKPDEPSWSSPWGEGRPGWHTECVAMSMGLLGADFDLHGGGNDLAFPHHENERAQSVALGTPMTCLWVHSGMVEMGGQKMSKSVGNVTNLVAYVAEHDPRAYRLLVLRSHYRSPVEVTEMTTMDAEAALERLDNFGRKVAGLPLGPSDPEVLARFRERMDDDLDTPAALALVFEQVRATNKALDEGAVGPLPGAAAALEILDALGVELDVAVEEVPLDIVTLAEARDAARAARDWARADAFRDEMRAMGWVAEDGPDGTVVRRA